MTSILNVIRYVPKHLALSVALFAAVLTSASTFAQSAEVQIEGNLAVANYTRGDTTWNGESVDASYDEVVRFKIYYHNTELPNSGLVADNLSIKVDMPTDAGSTQTVTASIRGDNTNTVVDTASVNLDRSDAYLEFVPGSVEWTHNTGDRDNIVRETVQIPDAVVTDGGYVAIEHQQPCFEYEAWITFMARVRVPSVEIEKQVADEDEQDWSEEVTSAPGEEVRYLLTVRNNGNARVNNVTVRDVLPEGMNYVAGTTKVFDSNHPGGVTVSDNIVSDNGINVGDLPNDTVVYITFRATMPEVEALDCGMNTLVNTAQVVATGFNGDEDTAQTKVNRVCEEVYEYDCTALNVTVLNQDERRVEAEAEVTHSGNVVVTGTEIAFGDGTTETTNPATHVYADYGEYDIEATVTFELQNEAKEVKEARCANSVEFSEEVENCPIEGLGNLTADDPNCKETEKCPIDGLGHLDADDEDCEEGEVLGEETLPNTGAGAAIFALFGATSAAAAAYGFVQNRRTV